MNFKKLVCLLILLRAAPCFSCQRDTVRLFYAINQSSLTPRHKATLDSLSRFVTDTTTVRVRGFADYLGHRDSNYTLSKARAETVKNYLLSRKLNSRRIFADGVGQVDAAGPNRSILGEPVNRRVEIIFTKSAPPVKTVVKAIPPVKTAIPQRTYRPPDKPKTDSVFTRINDLPKLNIGDSLSFKELTFLPGRHILRRIAVPYMVALKNCLKDNPNLKIEIQGHICCQYDNKDGLDFDTRRSNLSLTRAKFIYDYLVSEGINADRLRYVGLGSKEPKVYPELSAEDQNQNRRVVIVLLGK
jgi:outer membrane protein OmpA-like peptidoglycan-associated protein